MTSINDFDEEAQEWRNGVGCKLDGILGGRPAEDSRARILEATAHLRDYNSV